MVADLVRLAGEVSSPAKFEAAVLERLQRAVGFDVAFLSMKGAEASPSVVGLGEELVERAVRGGPRYYSELLPVREAALRARGTAVDTRVLGEQRVQKTAYYRELARTVGGRHTLMAYLPLRGSIVGGMMLGRCGSAFTDEQIARVESLLPELAVARASFGLPGGCAPLHVPVPSGLLGRLGWPMRSRVLASERIGETLVEVRDRDGYREMVARDHGAELVWTRASLRDPSESGWPYIELLHIAALQAKARRRAVFVGCGGAVALRQFARTYPGLELDLVEREARVVELARTWYALDQIPGLAVHIADGASFLRQASPASWDVAIIDAFDASDASAELHRPAFFAALQRALRAGGALAVNVIGTLNGSGPVAQVAASLQRAFCRVRVLPVMVADEEYSPSTPRNVVLVASKPE